MWLNPQAWDTYGVVTSCHCILSVYKNRVRRPACFTRGVTSLTVQARGKGSRHGMNERSSVGPVPRREFDSRCSASSE